MGEEDPFLVVKTADENKRMSQYLKRQPEKEQCIETSSLETSSTKSTATSIAPEVPEAPVESPNYHSSGGMKTPEETKESHTGDSPKIEFISEFGNGLEFGSGDVADGSGNLQDAKNSGENNVGESADEDRHHRHKRGHDKEKDLRRRESWRKDARSKSGESGSKRDSHRHHRHRRSMGSDRDHHGSHSDRHSESHSHSGKHDRDRDRDRSSRGTSERSSRSKSPHRERSSNKSSDRAASKDHSSRSGKNEKGRSSRSSDKSNPEHSSRSGRSDREKSSRSKSDRDSSPRRSGRSDRERVSRSKSDRTSSPRTTSRSGKSSRDRSPHRSKRSDRDRSPRRGAERGASPEHSSRSKRHDRDRSPRRATSPEQSSRSKRSDRDRSPRRSSDATGSPKHSSRSKRSDRERSPRRTSDGMDSPKHSSRSKRSDRERSPRRTSERADSPKQSSRSRRSDRGRSPRRTSEREASPKSSSRSGKVDRDRSPRRVSVSPDHTSQSGRSDGEYSPRKESDRSLSPGYAERSPRRESDAPPGPPTASPMASPMVRPRMGRRASLGMQPSLSAEGSQLRQRPRGRRASLVATNSSGSFDMSINLEQACAPDVNPPRQRPRRRASLAGGSMVGLEMGGMAGMDQALGADGNQAPIRGVRRRASLVPTKSVEPFDQSNGTEQVVGADAGQPRPFARRRASIAAGSNLHASSDILSAQSLHKPPTSLPGVPPRARMAPPRSRSGDSADLFGAMVMNIAEEAAAQPTKNFRDERSRNQQKILDLYTKPKEEKPSIPEPVDASPIPKIDDNENIEAKKNLTFADGSASRASIMDGAGAQALLSSFAAEPKEEPKRRRPFRRASLSGFLQKHRPAEISEGKVYDPQNMEGRHKGSLLERLGDDATISGQSTFSKLDEMSYSEKIMKAQERSRK